MTRKELIAEIKAFQAKANELSLEFDSGDRFFVEQKRNFAAFTGAKTFKRFNTGSLTRMNKKDLAQTRKMLEDVIKNPNASKEKREERYKKSKKTFLENHPDFTSERYDRWIKFMASDTGRAISSELKREYLCSEHEVQFMVDLHYNYRQIENAVEKAIPLCQSLGLEKHESCKVIKLKLEGRKDDEIMGILFPEENWD